MEFFKHNKNIFVIKLFNFIICPLINSNRNLIIPLSLNSFILRICVELIPLILINPKKIINRADSFPESIRFSF